MSTSIGYFDFNGGNVSHIDASLPVWAQDPLIYKGQFVPASGKKAVSDRRKVQSMQALTSGMSGKVTTGFARACLRARMVYLGCEKDAMGSNTQYLITEYTDNNTYEGTTVGPGALVAVAINRQNGAVFARSGSAIYTIAKSSPAPILFAMFPLFLQDPEFSAEFIDFLTETDSDEQKRLLCVLADSAYYICKDENTEASKVQEGSKIRDLTPTKKNALGKPTDFAGHYTIIQVSAPLRNRSISPDGRAMTTAEFVGKYKFYSEALTPEQEALVPKIDESYIVSENDVIICKCLHDTTGMTRPIRNILLRGAPGAGKSYMALGIAAGTHLPLYFFSAHAMTEPYDIFGQYVPADGSGNAIPVTQIVNGLPSAEDMALDPEASYISITGQMKPGATATDCMEAAFQKARENLEKDGSDRQFVFAPGQLVQALKGGGIWVFDEVSLINNPGVAPSLNPLMDGTQAITLPNGQVIHRHPNCIFLSTMNVEQEGCRRVNQAWQDRHSLIIDLEDPDDDALLARVKAMTDYDQIKYPNIDLRTCLDAYHQIRTCVKKHHVDDGVVGARKLADFVQATMVLGSARLAATITIIPATSTDKEVQEEVSKIINNMFVV